MGNKYITTLKGKKFICKNILINEETLLTTHESFEKKEQELLDSEDYEGLIELSKLKYFDFEKSYKFWDNFDVSLYLKILKAKGYGL